MESNVKRIEEEVDHHAAARDALTEGQAIVKLITASFDFGNLTVEDEAVAYAAQAAVARLEEGLEHFYMSDLNLSREIAALKQEVAQ